MQELFEVMPDRLASFRQWVRRASDHIEPWITDADQSDPAQERLVAKMIRRARYVAYKLKLFRLALLLPERKAMSPLSGWLYLRECARFKSKRKPKQEIPVRARAYTVKQTAELLAISERTVYDLIMRDEIGHHRVGHGRGRIRIRPADIEAYQMRDERPKFRHLNLK